jgi:hypothetical protein
MGLILPVVHVTDSIFGPTCVCLQVQMVSYKTPQVIVLFTFDRLDFSDFSVSFPAGRVFNLIFALAASLTFAVAVSSRSKNLTFLRPLSLTWYDQR